MHGTAGHVKVFRFAPYCGKVYGKQRQEILCRSPLFHIPILQRTSAHEQHPELHDHVEMGFGSAASLYARAAKS